jgi:hypothetical protein
VPYMLRSSDFKIGSSYFHLVAYRRQVMPLILAMTKNADNWTWTFGLRSSAQRETLRSEDAGNGPPKCNWPSAYARFNSVRSFPRQAERGN